MIKNFKMKYSKIFLGAFPLLFAGLLLMSADHIDAPAVTGANSDIADFYAFESPESSQNLVFAFTLQGLMSPASTQSAAFDENVLIEFNIDNDGDFVEDLVIQAIPRDGKMYTFGPYSPSSTGLISTIDDNMDPMATDISTYGNAPIIGTEAGMKVFAGPRDDPFFFDLGAYTNILGGTATGFSSPGSDTFAGTNALALVVEVPKSLLGSASSINTWVETKTKQ